MAEFSIEDFNADQEVYAEEMRAKYSAQDKKDLLKKGQAMPPSSEGADPGYPIADQADLEKAILAVGRGNADHDAIRKHIIDCAETLKLTNLIPDNWNADGSEKAEPEAKHVDEIAAEERDWAEWDAARPDDAKAATDAALKGANANGAKGDTGRNGDLHSAAKTAWQQVAAGHALAGQGAAATAALGVAQEHSHASEEIAAGDPYEPPVPKSSFDSALSKYASAAGTETKGQVSMNEHRADGSDAAADSKQCPECKGKGTILAGHRDCPVCKGKKTVPADFEAKSLVTPVPVVEPVAVEPVAQVVSEGRRLKKPRQRSGPPIGQEFRVHAVEGLEVRSAKDNSDTIEIVGKPIMYDQAYRVADVFGDFQETMKPGVAAKILQTADTRFLFNHGGMPLARTSSGTMTLEDSPTSLNFVAGLDARQQLSNDLAIAIERGDISQMSVGFIVGQDSWSDDMQERSITDLKELLDVSAVTYPCSTTTTIDIARRMWDNIPVESQARVRRMWSVAAELRGGKVLSADNANKLTTALTALHSVATSAGVSSHPEEDDVDDVEGNDPTNSNTDDGSAVSPSTEPVTADDGTGSRSEEPVIEEVAAASPGLDITTGLVHIGRSSPETKEERQHLRAVLGLVLDVRALTDDQLIEFLGTLTDEQREELEVTEDRAGALSYNDVQRAVENALSQKLGDDDGDCDFWIQDAGDGWAVFQSYIDPPGQGTYRTTYTIGDDGAVDFTSEPELVNRVTTWDTVPEEAPPTLTGRSAMQLELDLMLMHREVAA